MSTPKPTLQPEEAVARLKLIAENDNKYPPAGWRFTLHLCADLITALQAENAELKKERDELAEIWDRCMGMLAPHQDWLGTPKSELLPNAIYRRVDANADLARKLAAAVLRGDCLQSNVNSWTKWREDQPWLQEIQSYQGQVKAVNEKLAAAEELLKQSFAHLGKEIETKSLNDSARDGTQQISWKIAQYLDAAKAATP